MGALVTTASAIGGVGLVCAVALALAARFLGVEEDQRIEEVVDLLPGANCGGCGFAGCADYAKAMVIEGAAINLCAPCGAETLQALSELLGRKAEATEKEVAIVLCGGNATSAPRRSAYNGVADCAAAHAVGGGDKVCQYGCLGYGSCARVCPSGAIELVDGLATVHPDLCIGCGACVRTCPRHLIKMVPATRVVHVLCSSRAKGPVVKKACTVGCIGCSICTKLAEDNAIRMEGPLAVVDYSKQFDHPEIAEKCPGHCIVRHQTPNTEHRASLKEPAGTS